jgi:hypothetical protein
MNANQNQAGLKSDLIVFLVTLFFAAPSAAQGQDYQYTITNSVVTITRYTGAGGDVTIPSTLDGFPVTTIGNQAFMDCSNLTSIKIPDSVLSIESGLSILGWGWELHAGAFWGCVNLTTATIGNSVTNIGDYVFAECGALTTVTIGASVGSIPHLAFLGCTSLKEINVAPLNMTFSSSDGVLFDKGQTALIRYPVGRSESGYVVPGSVTAIGTNAFGGCTRLTSITLAEGLTNIAAAAFWGCDHLSEIWIPDSVTRIERAAFADCTGLAHISIGKGVEEIADDAFSNCIKLPQVLIPDNVFSLGGAFPGCRSLTHVIIGNGVTIITGRSCGSCGGIGCPPETHGTFADCSSLTSITIGKGVTNIQSSAFVRCDNLTYMTIPRGVALLEYDAFASCPNLAGIFFEGDVPTVIQRCDGKMPENSVFADSPNAVVYYLPGTTGWGPTFSERKAALWNPRFQTSHPDFGAQSAGFGLPMTGTANIPIVLEASAVPNGDTWVPLLTDILTNGALEFTDPDWEVHPNRFYRIRSP